MSLITQDNSARCYLLPRVIFSLSTQNEEQSKEILTCLISPYHNIGNVNGS
jgi:hypothetical protein